MNTEKIAFDIISLAGDAKAELQAALKLAHQGKFTKAQAQIDKATPQLQKLMNYKHKNYLHVKPMVKNFLLMF